MAEPAVTQMAVLDDHAHAMRLDAFPEDGGFPGSDPEMAFRHVIMEAGCDIGILEPLGGFHLRPEHSQANAIATNHWHVNHWLDSKTNWHGRWRGSICVAIDDPAGAVEETKAATASSRRHYQMMFAGEHPLPPMESS